MMDALRALAAGAWAVLRAPLVIVLALFVTVATVIPFGIALGTEVQTALSQQPPIDLAAQEIDAEWWMNFRMQARGLASTFTPAIIGFAAPLENISALFDRSPRPAMIALPVLLYLAAWAFVWGGAIDRFDQSRGTLRSFMSAGARHFVKMLGVSLLALVLVLLLYATVHVLLFDAVYPRIADAVASERDAFAARIGLYLVFGVLLAAVTLMADFTRVHIVRHPGASLRTAIGDALAYIRNHRASVLALFVLSGLLFVAFTVTYGLADRRLGGWRAIIAGQMFIFGRLLLRLLTAAAQVQLVRRHSR